jgi:hypothetical protein
MKLAQILATLAAFGLHARGSTTLTGAPGPADRLDKLLQHLGLSGSKLASGGFGRIRHFLLPNEPVRAGRFTRVLASRWAQDRGVLRVSESTSKGMPPAWNLEVWARVEPDNLSTIVHPKGLQQSA